VCRLRGIRTPKDATATTTAGGSAVTGDAGNADSDVFGIATTLLSPR
jgi:hypothetical protein